MSWSAIKNTFVSRKVTPSKNKSKLNRRLLAGDHGTYKKFTVKKSPVASNSLSKTCNLNLNLSGKHLFKHESLNETETRDILAEICTNNNFNISSSKICITSPCNKENFLQTSDKSTKMHWFNPDPAFKRKNCTESSNNDLNQTKIEDWISDSEEDKQEMLTGSRKSKDVSKNEFIIDCIISETESSSCNETNIISQVSSFDENGSRPVNEKNELDLLIRDLNNTRKKKNCIRAKKDGLVIRLRKILRSNRSDYFFWENELKYLTIHPANLGEILQVEELYNQTLLKVSKNNEIYNILVDLNDKIYKGQSFHVGSKIVCDIESAKPLQLRHEVKIFANVNKILILK